MRYHAQDCAGLLGTIIWAGYPIAVIIARDDVAALFNPDFRAANVLVAGIVPLHVVVADFGLSQLLHVYTDAASALPPATGAGARAHTVLKGDGALCPIAWAAPAVFGGEPYRRCDGVASQ